MRSQYLLYVVPKTQPDPSNQSIIYGGYHITLFPGHYLPENFDIGEHMKSFKMKKSRWYLPANSELVHIEKQGYDMIMIESRTLRKLMDHFQQPNGPFNPERRWEPTHLTLGEGQINEPYSSELYDIFMEEDEWFVQLVEKKPLKPRAGPNPLNYEWIWLKDQRAPLYRAV